MKTVLLGTSSMECSRLAYGCWRIAGAWEGAEFTAEREVRGKQAVMAAYEAGITLFDHADIYSDGMGETVFGKVLKEIPGMREKVVISSKCGILKAGKPNPNSPYRYDFSAGHIITSCEQSLKRLGIETLDVYLLHRPDYLANPEEIASAFSRLKQSGKVRHFGLSNARPTFFSMVQKTCGVPLIVNQVEINLLHITPFTDGTIDQCLAEKVTPMAWSPLAGGRLSYSGPVELNDPHHAHRLKIKETMDWIARDYQVSRTVIALAWLLKHPGNIVPIVGSTTPESIKELAGAVDLEISREDWYRLLEAAHGQRLP
ncbi:MAG: aldo/keto reductase [Verrucomicrobiota bacterium]|nr:aldo/keto reductase [Verrucomicrobiota bacterium]